MVVSLQPDWICAGRYRLIRELARGGMGALWVAYDLRQRRSVAVKFIHPTAAQRKEAHIRFAREARAAAQIRSPYVVQTFEYAVDDGHAFLVMELLEGEDLGVLLTREHSVSLARAAGLLDQIAQGLDAVHAASIIHRDMKPGNIFLNVVDGVETVKLIDFGAARVDSRYEERATGPGAIIGTLHYMAPEQTRGDAALDHRADLWALAVILYRLITASRPFRGATVDALIRSICTEAVTPPSIIVGSLPAAVDEFFERALARRKEERFSSATHLASAFRAAITSARFRPAQRRSQMLRLVEPLTDAATVGLVRHAG